MTKQVFFLSHTVSRQHALSAVLNAPSGYCVEIKPKTRTLEQNSRLWPMLTDVSNQVDWYGKKLSQNTWKDIFSAALKEQEVVPGIDGGFVAVGRPTSSMTVKEMADLQELISAFGANHGVEWTA